MYTIFRYWFRFKQNLTLISFYKNYADQISDDEDGKLVKMQYLNIIRYQKYLLTCLAPEKRFIEKFLRN